MRLVATSLPAIATTLFYRAAFDRSEVAFLMRAYSKGINRLEWFRMSDTGVKSPMGMMNDAQFDTLVKLARADPATNVSLASREVLVNGKPQADAREKIGCTCSRQSLSNAVSRYTSRYELVRSCYPEDLPLEATGISPQQFDALVELIRGKSESEGVRYARLRFIDGLSPEEASQALQTDTPRKSLNRTFYRYEEADQAIRKVFCRGQHWESEA